MSARTQGIRVDLARGLTFDEIARAYGLSMDLIRFEAQALARSLDLRIHFSRQKEEASHVVAENR
jgi:hypothetical protein